MDRTRVAFAAVLAAIAAGAVAMASAWPLKAALFPLTVGIPLLAIALAQVIVAIRGRGGPSPAAEDDAALPADVTPALAGQRMWMVFGWMAGFIVLVWLIGFPLTVPVFVFLYVVLDRASGMLTAALLAGATWLAFHGIFEQLLHLPFEPGMVQEWLEQ